MQNYYSENLTEGIRLLYYKTDSTQYGRAMSLLEQAAKEGEPDAYYVLARCYAWGDSGLPDSTENDKKALELSQRGAELGSALAVLGADRFGALEALKPFMKTTHEEAFARALEMADSGNALAMYAVGLVYFWGDIYGLPKYQLPTPEANAAEGLKWFDRAAGLGFIPAMKNAYISRRSGSNDVAQDIPGALALVERVQDHCEIPAGLMPNIGVDYEKIGRLEKMVEWFQRGAEAGEPVCMYNLANSYKQGNGVPRDEDKARQYYKMALDAGYAPAGDALKRMKKPSFWASLFKK